MLISSYIPVFLVSKEHRFTAVIEHDPTFLEKSLVIARNLNVDRMDLISKTIDAVMKGNLGMKVVSVDMADRNQEHQNKDPGNHVVTMVK